MHSRAECRPTRRVAEARLPAPLSAEMIISACSVTSATMLEGARVVPEGACQVYDPRHVAKFDCIEDVHPDRHIAAAV